MTTTVGQMTPAELRELIENVIEQKLLELLSDPDAGMELEAKLLDRLRRQQKLVAKGERGLSLDAARRQLALD